MGGRCVEGIDKDKPENAREGGVIEPDGVAVAAVKSERTGPRVGARGRPNRLALTT